MSRIPGREDKLCVFRLYNLFKMYWSTVAGRMKYFRGSHPRNLYEHGMYIFISFSCGLVVISPRADWRHTPGHSGPLSLRPNGPLTLRPNGPLYGQTAHSTAKRPTLQPNGPLYGQTAHSTAKRPTLRPNGWRIGMFQSEALPAASHYSGQFLKYCNTSSKWKVVPFG